MILTSDAIKISKTPTNNNANNPIGIKYHRNTRNQIAMMSQIQEESREETGGTYKNNQSKISNKLNKVSAAKKSNLSHNTSVATIDLC